jgi:hypothetical protein
MYGNCCTAKGMKWNNSNAAIKLTWPLRLDRAPRVEMEGVVDGLREAMQSKRCVLCLMRGMR